ncbi:hypothetical protein Tco_0539953 [Tanacetum coccineum]
MESVQKSIDERAQLKRQYDRRVNKRLMQMQESKVVLGKAVDADLVVMDKSRTESRKQDTSNSSGNYLTHVVDVDIKPVNDQVPFSEVQLTAHHNVLANDEQHTEQSEPIYDKYLLEKVDSNTTPDSTNMSHKGGEIDQDAEQYQVKSPLLNVELVKTKEMIEKNFDKASILGKPPLQPSRNHSVVRQSNAFKSERPRISKPRFASQVDEKNVLSKPIIPHYLPNIRESAPAKSHHANAPSSSRNSQKDSYSSNDMAHNYFLEEARKKTQDRNRNLKPREMPSARTHHTPNTCTPRPRSNNQTFKN